MSVNQNKKVAFITGSSRGIGFEIAYSLAKSGFDIILNSKNDSYEIKQAQKTISENTEATVLTLPFDITDHNYYDQAISQIITKFGRIDCLVNNAGISVKKRADLLDLEIDSFDDQIDTNLKAQFFLTQKIAKWMVKNPTNEFRSIITISSSNAEAISINRGEYCMAKAALQMMTKLFAVRLANENINTYDIMPGLIKTSMTQPVTDYYNEKIKTGFSPINRWGEPKDVSEVVTTIALGNMSFVTGESIHIDGGLLISRY